MTRISVGRIGAVLLFLALILGGTACGEYAYPAEDSSLSSHMTFSNVHSDASQDPAVITGSVTFNGTGTATHVVVAAKVGDATAQTSLSDVSSSGSQDFRLQVPNPGAVRTFRMHVVWVEAGATGRAAY
jgi:hypothetical protein